MTAVIASVLVAVAAVVHVGLFFAESVLFQAPGVWRRFGLESQQDADAARRIAYHQGFYNLFLAGGALLGLLFASTALAEAGTALLIFSTGCMTLGAIVLLTTGRRYLLATLLQGLPAAAALVLLVIDVV